MKKVFTSNGKFSFLIDDDDLELVTKHKWYKQSGGRYIRTNRQEKGVVKTYYLHRLIMNAPANMEVDHINGDTYDNRKSNLRLCSPSQNSANQKLGQRNTSGFKGVGYRKDKRKWSAEIKHQGKRIRLGYFNTAEEAATEYNKWAKVFFGEFAYLNVVA